MIKISGTSEEFDKHLLKVGLKENKEPLFFLDIDSIKTLLPVDSDNHQHIWALRKSVFENLIKSAKDFQNIGYTLKLMDAYRSLKTQKGKFLDQVNVIKKVNNGINNSDAMLLANTFVAGIPILAAHTAGAAVDVVLLDKKTNEIVDMGCKYLDLSDIAITTNTKITKKQATNREILKTILEKHGFINYPFEYWHYSIGDVCASYLTNKKFAKFGPVEYNPMDNVTLFPKNKITFYSFFEK